MFSTSVWIMLAFALAQSLLSKAQVAGPRQSEVSHLGLSRAEANNAHQHRGSQTRYVAKPGSVIVHFDRNHDIQQLQYVMQDGRLATLYKRNPNHPANTQTPTPVQVNGSQERAANEHLSAIDHDQTIEVIDDKRRARLMLVGNHLTVPLPDHELEGLSPSQKHRFELTQADSTDPDDDKLEILATVALDAVQAGSEIAEFKLKKAGVLLGKLKKKVSQKLHELPSIIESNLRDKSSAGQMYLDEDGRKFILVEDELDGSESSVHSTPIGQAHNGRQPIQIPAAVAQAQNQQRLPSSGPGPATGPGAAPGSAPAPGPGLSQQRLVPA